jgi:protein subunit release factor B
MKHGDRRELLFRVTRSDFDESHVRGSGPGGQHRNKVSTGVRLTHRASGATAEATDDKSQTRNRIEAFRRIRETPEWKRWFREMVAVTSGRESTDQTIQRMMHPDNITTQVLDGRSRWVTVQPSELSGPEELNGATS